MIDQEKLVSDILAQVKNKNFSAVIEANGQGDGSGDYGGAGQGAVSGDW